MSPRARGAIGGGSPTFATIVVVLAIASPGGAHAQPAPGVERCATAYEEGQRRQARGQLLDARREAAACAAVSCPAEIVGYCAKLVDELDAAIPTVVIAAVDDRGHDVPGVRVSLDGRDAGVVDGRPLVVDPGAHRLRGVAPEGGPAPASVDVTVRTGERNRRILLRFVAEREEPSTGLGYAPAVVAFALGGAGLALGATTGILALGQDSDLGAVCSDDGACPDRYAEDIDRLHTLSRLSTAGFVVAGVGVAAGVVLALVAKRSSHEPRSGLGRALVVRF